MELYRASENFVYDSGVFCQGVQGVLLFRKQESFKVWVLLDHIPVPSYVEDPLHLCIGYKTFHLQNTRRKEIYCPG